MIPKKDYKKQQHTNKKQNKKSAKRNTEVGESVEDSKILGNGGNGQERNSRLSRTGGFEGLE